MQITKTIAAGIVALTALTAVPASAASLEIQYGGGPSWGYQGGHDSYRGDRGRGGYGNHWRHNRLSTEEIRWMLRSDGYHAIRFFDDRGPVYQLRASKRGRDYFLVVSARSGEVISRQRI